MSEAAAKAQEARLIREKNKAEGKGRESGTCFKRLTAVFDIDGPRYRRSLNCGSVERVGEGQEDRGRVERQASRNLQKSFCDRDKLAAGRCLPISVVQRHRVLLERRDGCRLMAKLRLSFRRDDTTGSVDTSGEERETDVRGSKCITPSRREIVLSP